MPFGTLRIAKPLAVIPHRLKKSLVSGLTSNQETKGKSDNHLIIYKSIT